MEIAMALKETRMQSLVAGMESKEAKIGSLETKTESLEIKILLPVTKIQ